jgi:hypothetical protein
MSPIAIDAKAPIKVCIHQLLNDIQVRVFARLSRPSEQWCILADLNDFIPDRPVLRMLENLGSKPIAVNF